MAQLLRDKKKHVEKVAGVAGTMLLKSISCACDSQPD
jgi:hypothetical protein